MLGDTIRPVCDYCRRRATQVVTIQVEALDLDDTRSLCGDCTATASSAGLVVSIVDGLAVWPRSG